MTITEILIAEHRLFRELFDQIDDLLPQVSTIAELKMLASVVEGMLASHADAEKDFAYAALDHVMEDKGGIDQMHQDHHEIDSRLRRVKSVTDLQQDRRLLKAALMASREHFAREEQQVFPLLEGVLQKETLAALGSARVSG